MGFGKQSTSKSAGINFYDIGDRQVNVGAGKGMPVFYHNGVALVYFTDVEITSGVTTTTIPSGKSVICSNTASPGLFTSNGTLLN